MKRLGKSSTGFTLLETLSALVVLPVGLVGIVLLQMKTTQFNRDAYFATQATIIAHDMLERVRANVSGEKAGHYHLPDPIRHAGCFSAAGCSPLQMAQSDMHEWAANTAYNIASRIPAGDGVICIDSTPDDGTPSVASCDNLGSVYAIKVWWTGADGVQQRFVTTASLI